MRHLGLVHIDGMVLQPWTRKAMLTTIDLCPGLPKSKALTTTYGTLTVQFPLEEQISGHGVEGLMLYLREFGLAGGNSK